MIRRGLRVRRQRGQGLVEFAMAVPVLMVLLLGMLEFGFAFTHNITLEYASREGARVGASLANEGGTGACATDVDAQIVAAVQRVLTSSGSSVNISQVQEIRIYQADPNVSNAAGSTASGSQNPGNTTAYNRWTYSTSSSTVVDGVALKFAPTGTIGWPACTRDNGSSPDHLGVAITYTYRLVTPLGIFLGLTGNASFAMTDRTVMVLNPTN